MGLKLCPKCRLPVNENAERCHFCTADLRVSALPRGVPVAAAIAAIIATVALFARRHTA